MLESNKYTLLLSHRLVGILLLVYVDRKYLPYIKDQCKAHVGVGLFGHAGNKGGAGIRFKIYDSTICFVSAHLAAHKNNVQGRNQDYAKILQQMEFHLKEEDPIGIMDHDVIFWLGDLNYRLNHNTLKTVYDEIGK
eukprot:UN30510